jgi:hypothetical protein
MAGIPDEVGTPLSSRGLITRSVLALPYDQDQLPGRVQRLDTMEGKNTGPVNCIRWFGLKIVNVRVLSPKNLTPISVFLV